MDLTFNALSQSYRDLWDTMQISKQDDVNLVAGRLLSNKSRYVVVSSATGVPWDFIACIHERESGARFDRHLHNGDPLTERTVHVPRGRPIVGSPPFTWEDSAIDALQMYWLNKIPPADWTTERCLYQFEAYNGWGYRLYHKMNSPYVWAWTNHYTAGKYDSDDHFKAGLIDPQIGCAPLMKALAEVA